MTKSICEKISTNSRPIWNWNAKSISIIARLSNPNNLLWWPSPCRRWLAPECRRGWWCRPLWCRWRRRRWARCRRWPAGPAGTRRSPRCTWRRRSSWPAWTWGRWRRRNRGRAISKSCSKCRLSRFGRWCWRPTWRWRWWWSRRWPARWPATPRLKCKP